MLAVSGWYAGRLMFADWICPEVWMIDEQRCKDGIVNSNVSKLNPKPAPKDAGARGERL